jgi:bacterioferritin-associated ferredoxin
VSEPIWELLRSPDRRPLDVGSVREASVEMLSVEGGVLPAFDDAVVFDAWFADDGATTVVRAATVRDGQATPWEIRAAQLVVTESDGRLEALLAGSGRVHVTGELERQACACRGVSVDAAYRAIAAGWETVDAVKRATRIGFGPCQGRRCVPWLAARLELDPDDRLAQITPRPPLVPVPLSILAAFAPPDRRG